MTRAPVIPSLLIVDKTASGSSTEAVHLTHAMLQAIANCCLHAPPRRTHLTFQHRLMDRGSLQAIHL